MRTQLRSLQIHVRYLNSETVSLIPRPSVQCMCTKVLELDMKLYLIKEVDSVCVQKSGVGDLGVANGVKQLVLVLTTEWRLNV